LRVLRSRALAPILPEEVLGAYRRLRWGSGVVRSDTRLVRKPLARDLVKPALGRRSEPARHTLRALQIENLEDETVPAFLEQLDAGAARAGLELRHPFYDRRLVEFCVALPSDVRLRDGWTRWIQREALRGIVPDPILWLPEKVSLGGSLYTAIVRAHWPELKNLVATGGGLAASYLHRGALIEAFRRASQGEPYGLSDLFGALRLHWWLQALS
jgi:asparagine synthase (glutamine-hydrolysing)